ncbi:MAG: SH3 domain-containing protein [Rickettsiaceae bacterium]
MYSNIKKYILIISFTLNFFIGCYSFAKDDNKKIFPRFASIKFNEVNVRIGPSFKSNPILVFIKKGEPIKITSQYDNWYQIIDFEGDTGWIHSSAISNKRYIIIMSDDLVNLYKSPNIDSKLVVVLSPNIRCQLHKCKDNWCEVEIMQYKAWVEKKYLWGISDNE